MKALIIAQNAGRIWCLLEGTYTITVDRMKRTLGLDDAAFFAAIGWLAREKRFIVVKTTVSGTSVINNL